MTRWNPTAIHILGNNTTVSGNWLGVPPTGDVTDMGNSTSVLIEGGNDNTVGGTTAASRNVMGQSVYGVRIVGTDPSGLPTAGNADGNQVLGNYLGLREDGTTQAGNNIGVDISQAVDTAVGSATGRNVIAGGGCCSNYGIQDANSLGTVISANYIGTNAAGSAALPNNVGIILGSGSTATVSNNLISGNNNGVHGSYIGTGRQDPGEPGRHRQLRHRPRPQRVRGHQGVGVQRVRQDHRFRKHGQRQPHRGRDVGERLGHRVRQHDRRRLRCAKGDGMGNAYTGLILDNVRKGTVTGNTIAGNGSAGMYLQNSANLVLTGNRVGTDPTGEVSVGNNYVGINTCNLEDSRIGGSTPSERNILSGNNNSGISLDCDSEENVVRGNYIGRGADGSTSIPNGTSGIYLSSNSDRNVIGGNGSGAGNLIAGNGARGVGVSPGAQGNPIWGNSIFDNGQLGIDLNDDVTVNANDSDDTDVGGNNLQNFPVLTQAGSDGSGTVVKGSLNSRPDRDYRLEFFANSTCDPSGYGEGQRYLGTSTVTTDSSGNVSFTSTLPSAVVGAGEQSPPQQLTPGARTPRSSLPASAGSVSRVPASTTSP